jgi:MFS family permease
MSDPAGDRGGTIIHPATRRSKLAIVSSIGVSQVLVWGSSYYLPAVLAHPTSADTGWPLQWVIGSLSLGLLVSGVVSPLVGRLIERRGGRPVLASSAVLLAAGLVVTGFAPNLPVFVAGWVIIGLAMGAGLYDPAFSALGRIYGEQARGAITQVTLFGGFASTVCWPLSAALVAHAGWRGACLAYAAIALVIVLPLYLFGLPREATRQPVPVAGRRPGRVRPDQRVAFLLLAAGLTLASMIMTVIAVQLLSLLQTRGLTLAAAVGLGALVGPSQVGARVLEAALGRGRHPIWSLVASAVLVAIGLGMLAAEPGAIAFGLILYGAGSGVRSIAQGTVPLALFGREGYAVLMGRLALPKLVAQAASPSPGALLRGIWGADATGAILCAAAVVIVALAWALVPIALRPRGRKSSQG